MSNTNFDVEKKISYNTDTYRHYIPYFQVAFPYYEYKTKRADSTDVLDWISIPEVLKPYYSGNYCTSYSYAIYDAFISFDDGSEEQIQYVWHTLSKTSTSASYNKKPSNTYYLDVVNASGIYSKCYFRNPHRSQYGGRFLPDSCKVRAQYITLAAYEITLNNSGYVPLTNQTFYISTVKKNCKVQYPNIEGTVWYKKSSESSSSYRAVTGTFSGSWSNTKVQVNLPLEAGYTYNIKITSRTDQTQITPGGQAPEIMSATSNVANFKVTDDTPVTTCVSPNGTYTKGTINFIWSHSTSYGTKQYAYDLQYSANNGSSWTTVANHVVSETNNRTITLGTSGVYIWRVRTYNTLDAAGAWAQASFINSVPAPAPTGLVISTKGRPTLSWVSTAQRAYQVQMLRNDTIVYDSGAIYSGQNSHVVNQYFDDDTAYIGRVRIYNEIGNVSPWASRGYQEPEITDVVFSIYQYGQGGAEIAIEHNDEFVRYYIRRNGVTIGSTTTDSYIDKFAVGTTNYAVVGVTSDDHSDIKEEGIRITYPRATIVTLGGAQYVVNKRMDRGFEITVNNEADLNSAKFIGDSTPTHYFNGMKVRTFQVSFFDDNDIMNDLLGTVVFYADNFGNGGYCVVSSYEKTDSFIKNSAGIYGNEVVLTLEATNYDDSIEYQL